MTELQKRVRILIEQGEYEKATEYSCLKQEQK